MTFVDRLFPRSRATLDGPIPASTPPVVQPEPPAVPDDDLQTRRRALAQELADRQWDLGGMTYEMAVRDHFRLDVLVMHASRLQQIDAELAEIERRIRLGDAGAAGECPACGAAHSRGAVYCWSCGAQLIPVETAGT